MAGILSRGFLTEREVPRLSLGGGTFEAAVQARSPRKAELCGVDYAASGCKAAFVYECNRCGKAAVVVRIESIGNAPVKLIGGVSYYLISLL